MQRSPLERGRDPNPGLSAHDQHEHGLVTSDRNAKRRRSRSAPASPLLAMGQGDTSASRTRRRHPSRTPSRSPSPHAVSEPGSGRTESSRFTEESSESMSHWVYELVVVQHPQRARACGFGDKDRRPLSPPPIVRLYVRTSTGEEVDPAKVNISFLVLMVDLWSADGEHERNIVMHPGSIRPSTPPSRNGPLMREDEAGPSSRPGTSGSSRPQTAYHSRFSPGMQQPGWRLGGETALGTAVTLANTSPDTPASQGPSPHSRIPQEQIPMPLPVPSPPSRQGRFAIGIPPPRPPTYRSSSYTGRPPSSGYDAPRPFTAPSQSPSRTTLPSLSAVTEHLSRPGPTRLTLAAMRSPRDSRPHTATTTSSSRPSWTTESTQPTDFSWGRGSTSTWHSSSISSVDSREREKHGHPLLPPVVSPGWQSTLPTAYFHMPPVAEVDAPPSPPRDEEEQEMVGASYSRVLVGSLCATCLRLQDEDGEQGLFFFAHDLGVRTEGTFRLKFSLANIATLLGAEHAPSFSTPNLAEAFSDPFMVYSAKKFPGVVPTTELTKLFAGQNVRLPTRQRRAVGGDEGEEGED